MIDSEYKAHVTYAACTLSYDDSRTLLCMSVALSWNKDSVRGAHLVANQVDPFESDEFNLRLCKSINMKNTK